MQHGLYLDSCILLGSNSSYSALESDQVYLEGSDEDSPMKLPEESTTGVPTPNIAADRSMEFIVELQVK